MVSETPTATSGNGQAPANPVVRVDVRGPRFGAAITAVLLVLTIVLGLVGPSIRGGTTLAERVGDPAFILLAVITLLFAWGAFAGLPRHPYSLLFSRVVKPRISPTRETEDVRPPTFAQLVGFIVAGIGVVLALVGIPGGLVIAAAAAFVASFLNAAFGYCLGCQLYLLGVRLFGRTNTAQL